MRDSEKGPVEIEMVTRRVQTRLEHKWTGPNEWLVVTGRPLSDTRTLEPQVSPDATDQDAHYRYRYYFSPIGVSEAELAAPSLVELERVIKAGACIEASFERGKGGSGNGRVPGAHLAGLASSYGLIPDRGVVLDRGDPPGSAVDAGLDFTTSALWAERVAAGGVLDTRCVLHLSPSATSINAQRVARFDHYRTRNCLPPKKLRRDIQ